jgi:deoxycytidylate deaminase
MLSAQVGGPSKKVTGVDDMFEVGVEEMRRLRTDELVVGLCGPIGSPLHKVAGEFARLLEQLYGYECTIIRLSGIIEELGGAVSGQTRFERIQKLIESGNDLRREFGASVLADMVIGKIALEREQAKRIAGSARYERRRRCYIIDSIKNNNELEVLRLVYRDMFHFVGVFAPLHVRQAELEASGMSLPEVYRLIDRDSGEEIEHGQTVRDTFPRADFFIRAGTEASDMSERIQRLLDLILRTKVITPTIAETAMYQAASAAGNSACLSRQVGAAITDKDGEVLAIGWNDVPKFGGGLYNTPTTRGASGSDKRCFNWKGLCHNDEEKDLLAERVVKVLAEGGFVDASSIPRAISALRSSPIRALIEFSRSIHAEMHALLSAGHSAGSRLRGAILYCTTYPCHGCARHIVAAGISAVYYIEPYRKSQAVKLHEDALTEHEEATGKLRILPFDGVSPARFLEFFQMGDAPRKKSGRVIQRNPRDAVPISHTTLESIPALEGLVMQSLVSRNLLKPSARG